MDGKPGLNTALLDMLQKRKNEDPDRFSQVCLMLEGMAVRRHTQYDAHTQKMTGFVAPGGSLDETSVAGEALVFMVVGFQGLWKTAIAYFLIESPDTQMVLLQHALEALHERGIKVVYVTMDGHLSNINMCTMLGYHAWMPAQAQSSGATQNTFCPPIVWRKSVCNDGPMPHFRIDQKHVGGTWFHQQSCWSSEMELLIRSKCNPGRGGSACCQQALEQAHQLHQPEDEGAGLKFLRHHA